MHACPNVKTWTSGGGTITKNIFIYRVTTINIFFHWLDRMSIPKSLYFFSLSPLYDRCQQCPATSFFLARPNLYDILLSPYSSILYFPFQHHHLKGSTGTSLSGRRYQRWHVKSIKCCRCIFCLGLKLNIRSKKMAKVFAFIHI